MMKEPSITFTALRLHRVEEQLEARIENLQERDLPPGNTTVAVRYSSINYKDALAVTGKGKIIRGEYPFIPGIDLAGTIAASTSPAFPTGMPVIGTGWGLGEQHAGGYTGRQRLDHAWLVPLPETLSLRHAMSLGTAGFTAMLAVMALEEHGITPSSGDIAVTGATGGVGSLAVLLLARLGYSVVASTGKTDAHDYLMALGADRVIGRDVLGKGPQRSLDSGVWAGAVDAVGGDTLAALLSQTDRHGAIAACGLAGGAQLNTTVFPFILRGVQLLGIDSNTCPETQRTRAWKRLAETAPPDLLDQIAEIVPLRDVPEQCETLLAGKIRGRLVVDVKA